MRTEELIAGLSAGLTPVRRLRPPALRAVSWLGFAALVLAGAVAVEGFATISRRG